MWAATNKMTMGICVLEYRLCLLFYFYFQIENLWFSLSWFQMLDLKINCELTDMEENVNLI